MLVPEAEAEASSRVVAAAVEVAVAVVEEVAGDEPPPTVHRQMDRD